MLDEWKICRDTLTDFLSDSEYGIQFDPASYAQDLKENGFLNYFLDRLLYSYDTLFERQRIFREWFPEFGIVGLKCLSDRFRVQNFYLGADFLDSCLFCAEKRACMEILLEFFSEYPLPSDEIKIISGQLLAEEIISRGDYDRLKNSAEGYTAQIFMDMVSSAGIVGLNKFAYLLSSAAKFNEAVTFLGSISREISQPHSRPKYRKQAWAEEPDWPDNAKISSETSASSSTGSKVSSADSQKSVGSSMWDRRISAVTDATVLGSTPNVRPNSDDYESSKTPVDRLISFDGDDNNWSHFGADKLVTNTEDAFEEVIELRNMSSKSQNTDGSKRMSAGSNASSDSKTWAFIPIKYEYYSRLENEG